jgi:hypothetical protein
MLISSLFFLTCEYLWVCSNLYENLFFIIPCIMHALLKRVIASFSFCSLSYVTGIFSKIQWSIIKLSFASRACFKKFITFRLERSENCSRGVKNLLMMIISSDHFRIFSNPHHESRSQLCEYDSIFQSETNLNICKIVPRIS